MQQVITRTSEITFGEDGIIRTRIFEGANITLRDVQEYYSFTQKLAGGHKVRALIDGRADFTITDEARAFAAVQLDATRAATALVTSSAAVRMIYNLFLKINKPKTPTRMFSDEKSAVEWLRTFSTQ